MGKVKRVGLLIAFGLLVGCAEEPVRTPVQPTLPLLPTPTSAPVVVNPASVPEVKTREVLTVKDGDTLYSLGVASGFGYERLSAWNKIPKPYKLLVGQKIKLYDPAEELAEPHVKTVETPTTSKQLAPTSSVAKPLIVTQSERERTVSEPAPDAVSEPKPVPSVLFKKSTAAAQETLMLSKDKKKVLKLYWKWPIQGIVVKPFSPAGNKGIDIHAKVNVSVAAAADGEVVYSGNGLIGYGNLIIVRHDDVYLSAYANVAALLVDEGQKVTQGEALARCAATAPSEPSLHFEIRKNGKAVNPLSYLPAQ